MLFRSKGRSGPATTLRTPSQSTRWLEGIKKGYFDPKTGKPTTSGIQKHINMRTVGGTDFGKFKASGGDPRAALSSVQNAVTRAAAGDRAARSEVKKSYKSLTTKYRPPAVIRNTPAPTPVKQSEVSKQAAAFRQVAKPTQTPTPPTPAAAPSGGGSSSSSTVTPTKTKQTLKLAVGSPPKPTTSAPAAKPKVVTPTTVKPAIKPLPKLNLDKYKVSTFDPASFKPVAAKATSSATTAATKAAGTTASDIGKAVSDVLSKERSARAAEKAAATKAGWKMAGRIAAPLAATFDAKTAYDQAKQTGASDTRAAGAGAAKAIGGLVGGALGSAVGSIAGPAGTFVGGTAGYTGGAELASKAYKAVTGDPGKKLTTQGVLTNIRKAVPQNIRAQVPGNIRKGFTDFVKSAGRTYGNWKKSQQQNEEYELNEFQLPKLPKPTVGGAVRQGASFANPLTSAAGALATGATQALGQQVGGPVGGFIKKAAVPAGVGFSFTRAATPVGVVAATFNQGTAAGRVNVGKDKSGKPIYMDK